MTLTVCVGASGSGKTTFLNDVHKFHKCTYIRQYHNLRPYIAVTAIPDFDPTELPYWDIYIREKKDKKIIVGGTIGGQFMAGLSGGQRKLLLFELIFQRTATQENLLIVLDEPFAGVTDDFIPHITERLNEMRAKHNILLVTNDHVETLTGMANNTVTVSAIDRSTVKVNGQEGVDRELALLAMSIGNEYSSSSTDKDAAFFRSVELSKNGGLFHTLAFVIFAFGLFILTYWDSKPGSETLVLVAGGLVSFFALYPYLLQLVDWRIYMVEESEALLHQSRSMNKILKSCVVMTLVIVVSCIQFVCQDLVLGTLTTTEMFFGVLFDNISILSPCICLGLYSNLSDQEVQMGASLPFLSMIFFSTTFSPGAGVEGLKALRYLFPRFYLWCMLPGEVGMIMEGCPKENTLMYLILSSLFVPYLFAIWKVASQLYKTCGRIRNQSSRRGWLETVEFADLQLELFGETVLNNLRGSGGGNHVAKLL